MTALEGGGAVNHLPPAVTEMPRVLGACPRVSEPRPPASARPQHGTFRNPPGASLCSSTCNDLTLEAGKEPTGAQIRASHPAEGRAFRHGPAPRDLQRPDGGLHLQLPPAGQVPPTAPRLPPPTSQRFLHGC